MPTSYPINVPLVNYFFYNYTETDPGPNLPIAGGKVFFRDDDDHNADKPTFSDVSDPDNPVVNDNPLTLNDVGATPLYYTEPGLYYIVVTGPDGDLDNPVWTFEHVDFSGGDGNATSTIMNYVPNGQFLLHNDLPETDDEEAGEVRSASTDIAYGGWTFEVPEATTSVNYVTFERYDEWSDTPSGNPRYSVRIRCTEVDAGDAFKDLCITWNNVNRFSSETQEYTYGFSAIDNLAGSLPVDLYLIKNFGTGGSDQTEELLTTFNLDDVLTNYSHSFSFGTNEDKVIGTQNDDFVRLALRPRVDEESDSSFTDAMMEPGAFASLTYPEVTNTQVISQALGGGFPIPNPDGSDLLLTPRLTLSGWQYDDSEIGDVVAESQPSIYVDSLHPTTNRMWGDGSRYETQGYSPLGIPYSRLQSKYWNNTFNAPIYGTGPQYAIAYTNAITAYIRLTQNTKGAVTAIADGAAPTGMAFATIHEGGDYFSRAYYEGTNLFFIESNAVGSVTASSAGTSGFTVTQARNSPNVKALTQVITTASAGLAGDYFLFSAIGGDFYVWFKVAGVGADPAVGGRTGIQIDFIGTETSADVAKIISEALNGYEQATIIATAASTIPNSSYFNFNSPLEAFYVWFDKGSGVDPAVGGRTGIKVTLTGSETNAQVSAAIQIAINSKYFAVINLADAYLRGWDYGADVSQLRYSNNSNLVSGIGSSSVDDNLEHNHSYTISNNVDGNATQGGSTEPFSLVTQSAEETSFSGGSETKVRDTYVNYVIKY